jgi:hypothetical protein
VPELALKVGTTPTNDDGDILDAFSSRRIKAVHAQHACNAVVETDGSGLRIRGTLAELILQETRQYKFIRSGSVITRVNRLTSESEDVSDQIKIALFLERRLSRPATKSGMEAEPLTMPSRSIGSGRRSKSEPSYVRPITGCGRLAVRT